MRRIAIFVSLGLALAEPAAVEGHQVKPPPGRSTDQPRPRDGNIAIQEELDAARRTRTIAAYDMFIARHGDHPLAGAARRERTALAEAGGK